MGRRATTVLDSRTARLKLAPRKQSYFTQVADRLTLGYNRREQGAGNGPGASWSTRSPESTASAFGTADDYAAADGVEIFSFVQARAYVAGDGPKPKPASREPLTVNKALDDYLADLAARTSPANLQTARSEYRRAWADEGTQDRSFARRGVEEIMRMQLPAVVEAGIAAMISAALASWRPDGSGPSTQFGTPVVTAIGAPWSSGSRVRRFRS